MRKFPVFFVCLLLINRIIPAQIINKVPLSDRITGYRIDVRLDTDAKTVAGTVDGFWINRTDDTVPDIRMHLYMNAFRNNQSTYYKEIGASPGPLDSDRGRIEINSFTDSDNNDLLPLMQYISPDDGNTEDRTVIRVLLPKPVFPGDTLSLTIGFETKLPSRIRRTGYKNDFYFVAQWFPKFGVYEPAGMRYATAGGWNCHQFHANSEFYSNHSVYDVTINTPADYVVGSGGQLISESTAGEGRKTRIFRAEDIVDFAWTAWPGYSVFTDKWNHVNITLLLPEEREKQVERQFAAVKNALEFLTENVGPYPWTHLTFVDPPVIGAGAGGMEYTTFFTSQSSFLMPAWIHMPEMVTVHEFGHAYFMGILASNEFEEPWMDEGINSFWEQRIMDHYYGKNSGMINHSLLKIPDVTIGRLSYARSPNRQAVTNSEYSWNYPHGTYGMMSYNKPALVLHTLMGIIGEETIDDIFREYYRKWAFKHPSGRDFIQVVNEVVRRNHGDAFGQDMNWFFDQTLFGTGICDYRVGYISNRKQIRPDADTDIIVTEDPVTDERDSLFTSIAELERVGEVMLPVEVLVHFTDGAEVLEKWDGKSRFKDFTYSGRREIEWVRIDPEFRIKMDVNYINNSRTIDPDPVPVRRMINKFISLMQFCLSIMLL
jgi:hypothetical protein